jgi:phosphoribosylanthranilate isomerase
MTLLVKICGLSTPDALDAALDAGADMVGFVFFAPSPRHIAFDTATALGARVRTEAKKVALTVDANDEFLAEIVKALKPDLLQLHGKESLERVAAIKARFGLPVIKALPVESNSDLAAMQNYAGVADWLLLDAKAPADATRPGGLGKPFDWTLLAGARCGVPVMLSGGLDAGNVGAALGITRPAAVDVSSGVESAPGRKDVRKIREFIHAARQAYLRLPSLETVSGS